MNQHLPLASLAAIRKPSEFRMMQAKTEIPYRFEELSLEIEDGFRAGSYSGNARVTIWNDPEDGVEWFVHDIYLDCSKWNGSTWEFETIELDDRSKLYSDIWGELMDGSLKDSVDAAVRREI